MTTASREIVSILHRYVQGMPLEERETTVFEEWVGAHPDNESVWMAANDYTLLLNDLSRLDEYHNTMPALLRQFWDQQGAPSKDIMPFVHRVHFLRRGWFRYAAVVLLVGGVAVWWEISHSARNDRSARTTISQKQDIQPGSNRAVLTIGNKTIDLASDKTGIAVNSTITYTDGKKIADGGQLLLLATPKGGQYQAVLPDGSKVWLNAASSIKFPSEFAGNRREIEVTGEAYLEVAKHSQQPFYVHTNKTTIQVLGTSFNINAYKEEQLEKTTLIEGSVRVSAHSTLNIKNSTVLTPGQEAVIHHSQITIHGADIEQALAWKNGMFHLTSADIPSIMRQISRWYDVEVEFMGGVPAGHITGEVPRNTSLLNMLEVLKTTGINFKLEGRKLTVMP